MGIFDDVSSTQVHLTITLLVLEVHQDSVIEKELHHLHFSDDGTNFTSEETQQFVRSRNIKWNFNPPTMPWWRGAYERVIESVNLCWKKALCRTTVRYEKLRTILRQI